MPVSPRAPKPNTRKLLSSAILPYAYHIQYVTAGMRTELMGTILEFASVPPRQMGTLLLGSWWP